MNFRSSKHFIWFFWNYRGNHQLQLMYSEFGLVLNIFALKELWNLWIFTETMFQLRLLILFICNLTFRSIFAHNFNLCKHKKLYRNVRATFFVLEVFSDSCWIFIYRALNIVHFQWFSEFLVKFQLAEF